MSKRGTGQNQNFSTTAVKAKATTSEVDPTNEQLRLLGIRSSIPMIGFGFMDNLVMIQAGEMIDISLGVTFGLSTLTAAGFGQIFSDVAGVLSGGAVDNLVSKLQIPHHNLSVKQLSLKSSRMAITSGQIFGVIIGCLLGMSCLLFMDTSKADRMKKAKELDSIFEAVMINGCKLIGAERATLWMVDKESFELWSRVTTTTTDQSDMDIVRINFSKGIVGRCYKSGKLMNIKNAYADERYYKSIDSFTGYKTQSLLCCPVESDGEIIAVIQMINKKNSEGFNDSDISLIKLLKIHK